MTDRIYISYRRDGSEALAYLINERLTNYGYSTCCDISSPRTGEFDESLYAIIRNCDDVVIVLSPRGFEECCNEDDWVRKELIFALKENKNIIPVMSGEFEIPEVLPEAIEELKKLKGVSVNMERFDDALEKLTAMLRARRASKLGAILSSLQDERLKREIHTCAHELTLTNSADAKYKMAVALEKLKNNSFNEEIARFYSEAASMGHSAAQNNLGNLYEHGIGVERNILKAFDYYKMSADNGCSAGQHNLACTIVNDSKKLYFGLMKMAADQNDIEALIALADCYEAGYGVRRNYKKARECYERLVALGREDYKSKITDSYWRKTRVKDFFLDFFVE